MPWIKRNLVVVISAAVALALFGFGGWYLWSAMEKNKAVDEEIGGLKSELNTLTSAPQYPSASNIAIAQRELKRVNDFAAEAKKFFPPSPAPASPLNNQTFAALLHNTIDELTKEATAAGIRVETNYHYSFDSQWLPVSFPPASLQPLNERLAEVKQLSSLLFKAKVNRLERVRRARVNDEVPAPTAAGDYVNETPNLNAETGMTMWPYEVVFHSFTPELATVLEGISRMPEAYVVRSVVVDAAEPMLKPLAPVAPANAPPARRGARPGTVAPTGLETILNERLLRVVMKLEVIKPAK
ncbi:MAG TPA: Amuc_1100 family pilus-like protein [Candidatus Acidoferrum sp.]|nr:Amuc_1100 family pilus-like protein [Candidatus Acidoferrum sp.]